MVKTLSVVLATFNEEKNLPECLESVKDIADEIIVVDGSSKDKTVAIAKEFGAKVKSTTNKQMFHINKQIAIDLATKDWIFQLDADERVTPELEKEITSVISDKKSAINGYWIPRKNWFLGRFLMKGGVYPDYTLRLYRRGKGRLPQKSVHEQAVVVGRIGYLKNPLIHMADTSFSRYLLRWNRYVNLIRDELSEEKPGRCAFFHYLIIKPLWWFLLTYIRHKGFQDNWQGFVFSFFSALRFPIAYMRHMRLRPMVDLFFICSFLLCILFATGSVWANEYVLPYPGFMPGSRFYKVSEVIDRLEEWWSFGSFSKFSYYLSMSDKKLIEAKTLFEYNQYFLGFQALLQSDAFFNKASQQLSFAKKEGKDIAQKEKILHSAGAKHSEVLQFLLGQLPEIFVWRPEKDNSTTLPLKSTIEQSIQVRQK